MFNARKILAKIDFEETIISANDESMMLIEFVEAHRELLRSDVALFMFHSLFTEGVYYLHLKNGDFFKVKLERLYFLSERYENKTNNVFKKTVDKVIKFFEDDLHYSVAMTLLGVAFLCLVTFYEILRFF